MFSLIAYNGARHTLSNIKACKKTLLEYAFLTYIKAATNQLHVVLHNNLESYIARKRLEHYYHYRIYEYLIRNVFWIIISRKKEISKEMCSNILFGIYDVKMRWSAQYSLVICTSYIYQIAQLITMLYLLSCGTRTFFLCTLSFSFYSHSSQQRANFTLVLHKSHHDRCMDKKEVLYFLSFVSKLGFCMVVNTPHSFLLNSKFQFRFFSNWINIAALVFINE